MNPHQAEGPMGIHLNVVRGRLLTSTKPH